jgi:hypothetical protein
MSLPSEELHGAAACRALQGRFKDYMVAEIACMCEEIGTALPDDPDEVNRMLMQWIEKNAQKFRNRWLIEQAAQVAAVN